ncbi:Uncharacterised protein [Chryseobacterium nakagawai]|uniref:Uncharacterized protein n=1 Tax=Chryseobacterium nakagawai TaxID=1241982 RepID=A0AAD1DT90_CHRNA|nr:hypothetical protein [Chryseobacterium nakagawai]AZA93305.1 hypothetical protein EG343_23200 [Chryseobacterium nakagawai]VEH19971.1 Uncharacterised protein [Chryseobacterium nakagawai]
MIKPVLQLPKTIRFLKEDELPQNNVSVLKRWEESKVANIVEGYTLTFNNNPENNNLGFKFYAEINIDNPKLWNLMVALSETLPNEVAFLFGHIDFDLNYGNYQDKESTLNFITQHQYELAEDAFINFGLIYNDKETLIEIFVDESKYVKYWGVDEEWFRAIMKEFGLKEVKGLEFVDEFPKIREALAVLDEKALDSKSLIELFAQKYL